ncbi:Membrane associated serine protease, rhomboid family [Geoalkalibacter ferrihydriticus]|uniref:Membrane associated serine protease, rhomboid family n=1 Tax=Geoalkalibacter ferrihydriticus TaxID=392333 RepID=A0A1G9SRH0_9BACT|nr:rhomboid family intramembrane serine protease [Geoalkalibacter ferrihydriticus]SDM37947.1 Membrane associated serine protease, rhomboid family [Geoalkalibacter ferrihydriticus]
MFLPIGDHPNPRSTPWVNYLLLGINLAVWLLIALPMSNVPPELNDPVLLEFLYDLGVRGAVPAQAIFDQISAYDLFVYQYGFRPADPSLLTLFSSLFLHGGWMHLFGNMLFLWIFGNNVEHRLGSLGYLGCYLGAGVAATLFFALFVPDSTTPLIGASGAISGVLGFYFLWFPRNLVRVFIFLFPFIVTTVMVPARLVLGFYLVLDNILPFLLTRGGAESGVAYGAHIGGFLVGLGLAWGLEKVPGLNLWRSEQRYRKERVEASAENDTRLSPAALIHHHLINGHPRQAADLYLRLKQRPERLGVDADDVLAIGDHLLAQGRDDLALPVFRRFIAERPGAAGLDRAFLGAGQALERHPRHITSAYQYFLQALDVARSDAVKDQARLHLRAIERRGRKDNGRAD